MESAKKASIIDENKVLETIVNSPKYGKNFLPEVEGRDMLIELLHVEETIAAGRDSIEYKNVKSAYRTIMDNLIDRQKGIIRGITPTTLIEKPAVNNYDESKTATVYRRVGPYRGVYGNYSMNR
jgi:hypothetical protein